MPIPTFIAAQPAERQKTLKEIHKIIIANDKTITPVIEPMMGKEMIIYKAKGSMKYALASGKEHMSLHVLPMYMHPNIYDKYKVILSKAKFQKGCINFKDVAEMPAAAVVDLITDCAPIDLVKIREEYLAAKKTTKKK